MKYLDKLTFAIIFLFFSCQEQVMIEKPTVIDPISSKNLGILVNLSADGLIVSTQWGKSIDLLNKEEIVQKLYNYIDSYTNSQVSTLIFNVNYQRSCFPNKVMETYWNVNNPDLNVNSWPLYYWQIHKKGIDPFEVSISRSKAKGISPWISIRMNDHHYFNDSSKINHLWLDHPEYRLNPTSMFNYSRSEVRNYFKAYIGEILDRYDVDGIELDWMRTYFVFKSGTESQGGVLLNDFMADVKRLVDAKSLERGHSIKIAVRIPPTISICEAYGFDVISWVKKSYVDVIIPTNWYRPSNFDIPIESWRKNLGVPSSKCKIIPSSDDAFMIAGNIYVKGMNNTLEVMKGFAVSAFSRGADGVCLFNNFLPTYNRKLINSNGIVTIRDDKPLILSQIGDISTALNGTRTHVLTYNELDKKSIRLSAIALNKGEIKDYEIHTGPRPFSGLVTARIGLDYSSSVLNAKISVFVNSEECFQIEDVTKDPSYVYNNKKEWDFVKHVSETSYRVLQFSVAPSVLRDGYNIISIKNESNNVENMTWLEVSVD